ncbi:P-loop containing nucleoside triphosphate hydrolase protein [Hypoxylon sp. FL0890]|nr:P-loop containing nucleoside triphosphate hydrolase protein [Hypoxylon sp. FL0890]
MEQKDLAGRLEQVESRLNALDRTFGNYVDYQGDLESLVAKGFDSVRELCVGRVEELAQTADDRFTEFGARLEDALEQMTSLSVSGSNDPTSDAIEQLEIQLEKAEAERNEAIFNVDNLKEELRRREVELEEALETNQTNDAFNKTLFDDMIATREKNRALLKQLQDLKGNIRVMCRIRPAPAYTPKEDLVEFGPREKGEFTNNWGKLSVPVERKTALGRTDTVMRSFDFERIFGPEESNNDIFDEISELVECALDGDKVGIFAYGQTGAGKTHTLCNRCFDGYSGDGMICKTLALMFDTAEKTTGYKYSISMSVVEIYVDKTYDLLREPVGGDKVQTRLEQAKFVSLTSIAAANEIIEFAMDERVTSSTEKNSDSSRSHLILTFRIDKVGPEPGQDTTGFLYLVDLAGSERSAAGGAQGTQLQEGIKINKSLMSLNLAITALGKGTSVSYDTDLTRALRPVLCQGSKTLMFVMISPLKKDLQVSIQTLEKGQEASNAKLAAANRGGGRQSSISKVTHPALKARTESFIGVSRGRGTWSSPKPVRKSHGRM